MADFHKEYIEPSFEEKEMMSELMYAYIFPNTPKTDEQQDAFDKAVRYQIDHEKTLADRIGEDGLPQGVKQFTIGHFSATLDTDDDPAVLNRKTICPYAHSVLLGAGLLYRGVKGGGDVPWLSSTHFSGRL